VFRTIPVLSFGLVLAATIFANKGWGAETNVAFSRDGLVFWVNAANIQVQDGTVEVLTDLSGKGVPCPAGGGSQGYSCQSAGRQERLPWSADSPV
jgi:hypothetical protein